jgi:hypothetical protein
MTLRWPSGPISSLLFFILSPKILTEPADSPLSPHVPRLVLQPSPRSLDPRLRVRRLSPHPSSPRYKHASACRRGAMKSTSIFVLFSLEQEEKWWVDSWIEMLVGTQHSTAGGGEMFVFGSWRKDHIAQYSER